MPDMSPGCSQQASEVNALNAKLAYDGAAQLQNQGLIDNQVNARALQSLQVRIAEDAQTIKQLAALNVVTSAQTGQTENEQTVSPVRTGTGDALVGSIGVSADTVAAAQANLMSAMTPVIAAAVANAVVTAVSALYPVLVTASGGASTPSQTQVKPTA